MRLSTKGRYAVMAMADLIGARASGERNEAGRKARADRRLAARGDHPADLAAQQEC